MADYRYDKNVFLKLTHWINDVITDTKELSPVWVMKNVTGEI